MHGTSGKEFDRVSQTWVSPDEMARRRADWAELEFQRRPRQGQLCAPAVFSDCQGGVNGLQSMADGRFYDSKSAMREHYRRDGLQEVGNDSSLTSGKRRQAQSRDDKDLYRKGLRDHIGQALQRVSDSTPGGIPI